MRIRINRKRVLQTLAVLVCISAIGIWSYFRVPWLRLQCVEIADRLGMQDTLVGYLGDENRNIKNAAYVKLVSNGSKSVPALLHGLENDSAVVRKLSAAILGWIDPPATESIAALRARMTSDPDEITRLICAQSVGRIGKNDAAVCVEFVGMLEHGNEDEGMIALHALSVQDRPIPKLKNAFHDQSAKIRDAAARYLTRVN